MPNWCKNNIEIIGPKREIKSLWEEIMQNKDKGLLSAICPQPDNMFHGNLGERERQLCARKNIPNWYDWNIKNWGTKWDVSTEDLSFVFDAPEFGKYFVDPKDGSSIIHGFFESAWTPPIQAYKYFLEKNPSCKIIASYYEVGMDFAGYFDENGLVTEINDIHSIALDVIDGEVAIEDTEYPFAILDSEFSIIDFVSEWEQE